MLSKLTPRVRRWSLLSITALVVAYVRNFLQYRHYSWESIDLFLISWFIHYFVVALLIATSYAFINAKTAYFLEKEKESRKISFDEAMVYVSIVLLTAAVCIFLIAYWTPTGASDYE